MGKSTVSTQIAQALSSRGYSVGLLDLDICGPSVPRMVGVQSRTVHQSSSGWEPVYANPNLGVMSISFLLEEADAAVVWRGPRKNGLIKQFLVETDWGVGGLDYLIVDTPPGTSDEHISIVQYLNDARPMMTDNDGASLSSSGASGAIVVTTPEEVSMADVRKELNFCKKTKVPVLGVIENMSGLQMKLADMKFIKGGDACDSQQDCTEQALAILKEKCPEVLSMMVSTDVFPSFGLGPSGMASQYNVPYLGKLPLDPNLLKACEEGVPFVEKFSGSPAAKPLNDIVDKLILTLPVEDDDEEMES